MRAEIPIDYNSGDTEAYLKEYRNADMKRSQRWKERGPKVQKWSMFSNVFILRSKKERGKYRIQF